MLAILSDLHSNIEALSVVIEECARLGVKDYLCLGDVIGYGLDPVAVAKIAKERFTTSPMGNHEEALVTRRHRFNPHAAQAIDWTRRLLTAAGDDLLPWFKERKSFALRGPFCWCMARSMTPSTTTSTSQRIRSKPTT